MHKLTGGLEISVSAGWSLCKDGRLCRMPTRSLSIPYRAAKKRCIFSMLSWPPAHAHVVTRPFLDSPRVLNSTTALELRDIPQNLLVIGGGYIGLELGTVYAALGTQVTVVELTGGLLPGVDRDLVGIVAKRLARLPGDFAQYQSGGAAGRLRGYQGDLWGARYSRQSRCSTKC